MHTKTGCPPPPLNHVFVDYENVHTVDPVIFGETVRLTLLLGAQKTKFDAALVEKLLHHAANVKIIRLKSSGRNASDFALAYYLACAVQAEPCGFFHIISKDTGYDALLEHLRSVHVQVQRHDDFTKLTFNAPAKPSISIPPVVAPKPKLQPKPKVQLLPLDGRGAQVLEHLRRPVATHPRSQKRLISFLVAFLGNKITDGEALALVEHLQQAGHITIGEKGAVTYHLKRK